MKNLKIVIKCEGLFVRTKDLKMGQSILNRMSDHGIMKEAMIPYALLDKASKMFDIAGDKISKLQEENSILNITIMKMKTDWIPKIYSKRFEEIKKKSKDETNLKAIATTKKPEEENEMLDDVPMDKVVNKSKGKKKKSFWTKKETEALTKNITMKPKSLKKLPWLKNKTLKQISSKKYILWNAGLNSNYNK